MKNADRASAHVFLSLHDSYTCVWCVCMVFLKDYVCMYVYHTFPCMKALAVSNAVL